MDAAVPIHQPAARLAPDSQRLSAGFFMANLVWAAVALLAG